MQGSAALQSSTDAAYSNHCRSESVVQSHNEDDWIGSCRDSPAAVPACCLRTCCAWQRRHRHCAACVAAAVLLRGHQQLSAKVCKRYDPYTVASALKTEMQLLQSSVATSRACCSQSACAPCRAGRQLCGQQGLKMTAALLYSCHLLQNACSGQLNDFAYVVWASSRGIRRHPSRQPGPQRSRQAQ